MLSSRAFPAHVNTRTPGRSTRHRGENASVFLANHKSMKKVQGQTPYHPSTSIHTASPSKKSTYVLSRPLQDKTPFPNRTAGNLRTPAPGFKKGKLAQEELQFSFDLNTPGLFKPNDEELTPLPSSMRKSIKVPRGSGQFAPVTPMNKGNHWDVIEDLEFDLSEQIETEQLEQHAIEEDDDDWEIEYMPPKLEVPYQPPFDFEIPDYKVVEETLRNFMPPTFPKPPSEIEFNFDPEIDLSLKYTTLSVEGPDIDDPFYRPPKPVASVPAARKPLANLGHRRIVTTANFSTTRPTTQAKPSVVSRPRSATTTTATNRAASATSTRVASSAAVSRQPMTRPTTAIGSRPKPKLVVSQPSTRPSSVAATRVARSSSLARAPSARVAIKPTTEPKTLEKDKDGIVLNFFDSGPDVVDDFQFDV